MIDSENSKLAFQKQADLHSSDLFTFRPLPQSISALLLLLHFRNSRHLLNLLLNMVQLYGSGTRPCLRHQNFLRQNLQQAGDVGLGGH
ncbi:hypothetical protein L3X38_016471 [Prunus dulcis]|uniref:Uncharacterized protein n=1 Tax=Prunus dulcis TaxID=3755 RepID=A0AAD4W816_PRUDU|nr:hypothetical protein L3X38_016471 [Prunus dulcis]